MLMTLRKRMMKNRKKGFTLVEVIVVLVIIAILAAIAIPALTGYIDKANEKAVLSQTRSAVVAAQTIVSNAYGEGQDTSDAAWSGTHITVTAITALSGDATITGVSDITVVDNAVQSLKITTSSGKTGVYNAGGTPPYTVE